MDTVFQAIFPFRYPIGTFFSRQHAQLIDVIHTMHTMHKQDEEGWLDKFESQSDPAKGG